MQRHFVVLLFCLSFLISVSFAQPPSAPADMDTASQATTAAPAAALPKAAQPLRVGPFTISGSWRFRAEAFDWFEAAPANNSYGYADSLLRLNIALIRKSYDVNLELTQPSVLGLPNDAVAPGAPGQLGLGASYFVSNDKQRYAASIYPSKLFVRFKGLGGKDENRLTLGRFEFVEGMEPGSKDKTLSTLKTMRIAHRLIGNFAWSTNPRNEDGISGSFTVPGNGNFTFAAARPTRGVFQMDGLGELDVAWQYGAYTVPFAFKNGASELRIFGVGYQDMRAVAKTDNRPAAIRSGLDRFENINIGSFGANYLHVINSKNAGKWDLLFWAVGQTGTWGVQNHRAGAADVEFGWQPKSKVLKPWFRAGYFIGSGDGNANDNEHNTFFQVLPTPRWYARYPFYNMQNSQDASATMILRPGTKWNIRSEFHNLSLASRNDLWYQGGGAFQPRSFGYVGRPSNGHKAFANLWDVSTDYQISPRVGVGFYFANVWGQSVISALHPQGDNSKFGYAELTYKF